MQFEPRLAEKWERLDPLTVRFHLRKDVTFHSGAPFTAKDVAWAIARLKTSQDFKGLFEIFDTPVVVDDQTIDIKTKVPYPLLLNMATYIFPMDSKFYTGDAPETGKTKDAMDKTSPTFAPTHESGTGKYMVTQREHGVRMEFTQYKNYWDKNTGNVDKIILTPIKEDATRLAPCSRATWTSSCPCRPRTTAAGQQAPEGFLGYTPELKPRFDLDKAKKLMKEAGYEGGFTCSMIAPNNRYVNDKKIAQAVASMLAKINIKVDLKTMPKAQYWDEFDAQVADIQLIGWHPDTEDSANHTEYLLMCPNKDAGMGAYNSGNYCNARVDELVAKSNSETDVAKRTAMLQEIERIAYDDAAFIPLHWQHLSWAGSDKLVNPDDIVNVMNFPYFGDLNMQ